MKKVSIFVSFYCNPLIVFFPCTTEQEKIIKRFESRARLTSNFYRLCFATASIVLSILFFFLSYTREELGETIGKQRAQIVHLVTGLGFVAMAIRAWRGRRERVVKKKVKLTPQQVEELFRDQNRKGDIIVEGDEIDSQIIPRKPVEDQFDVQPLSNLLSQDEIQNVVQRHPTNNMSDESSFQTPFTQTSFEQSASGIAPSTISSPNTKLLKVLEKELRQEDNRFDTWILFAILASLFELWIWSGTMYSNYEQAFVIQSGSIKIHLFLLPSVLPFFTCAVEYALKLMKNTRVEIADLYGLTYKFKKA